MIVSELLLCTHRQTLIFFLFFLHSGKRLYSFLRRSVFDGALPSVDTLLTHHVTMTSPMLNEPGFTRERFRRAVEFFRASGYRPMIFHLCNDGTVLRRRIVWRRTDNAVFGLNSLDDHRCPDTLEELIELVKRVGYAEEVDVLMLCPLDPSKPAYVLAVFPQQHIMPAEVYLLRWAVAERELETHGAFVISHGVDGAAPHLRAEKARQPNACIPLAGTHLPPPAMNTYHSAERNKSLWIDVPALEEGVYRRVEAPARMIPIVLDSGETLMILLPDLHFQDFCHLGAKLRVRICGRNGHGLTIGSGRAVIALLKQEATSAMWLQMSIDIHSDDFDPKRDPMNLPAFFRLTSTAVLAFLQLRAADHPAPMSRIPVTNAEELTLTKMRYIVHSRLILYS